MPSSMLFGVNNEGRVFGLSTNGSQWREFPYLGLDFKHVSGVPHFLWAIGGDRQIYVHVHGLDVPIRVKEEAFENQRWLPLDGFSSRLLPTDRFAFSSEDGLTERRKDKIRLPSMAWQWESDWQIETSLDGQPLDHDGWTYAVDFPATFHPSKQWSSCVRRRKWVRARKYMAVNSWCAVAPLHKDPTQEPFIDVCVGGTHMVGGEEGALQVWAVTAHGRAMWRKGVKMMCPEGTRWNAVPTPGAGWEVRQISCGPTGLVWAVLWSGKALVRAGVTGANPIGETWLEVESPEEQVKLYQVSVGTNAVWATSTDSRVWFRRGVHGEPSASHECLKGSGWIEMVGDMASVSVASNDQVFGVGSEDRCVYMRMGVTPAELTGRRWRQLHSPVQISSRASSLSSLNRFQSNSSIDKLGALESRSAPTSLRLQTVWSNPTAPSTSLPAGGRVELPATQGGGSKKDEEDTRKLASWSPVRSVGSLLGLEANPETETHMDDDWERQVFPEREMSLSEPGWTQAETMWSTVEAGALSIDPSHLPNWFTDTNTPATVVSAPWRNTILTHLRTFNTSTTNGFEDYPPAVELTSSVKTVECRCLLPGSNSPVFDDCSIELEWIGNQVNAVETGTLTVLDVERKITRCQLTLSEVVCVVSASEPGHPRLAVHTMTTSTSGVSPLTLQFAGDVDHDDWLATLSYVLSGYTGLQGSPGPGSVWATTKLGEVFAFDPITVKTQQKTTGQLYQKDLDCVEKPLPWGCELANGFTPGSSLTVHAFIPQTSERFSVNLVCGGDGATALHINPRFKEGIVVRNSKEGSEWGPEEREGPLIVGAGSDITIDILCQDDGYQVSVNGVGLPVFHHRVGASGVTGIRVEGSLQLRRVTYVSRQAILGLGELVWRQIGGHLARAETCAATITWGLSADRTPYLYTGGWGGGFLGGLGPTAGVRPQQDTHSCFVYENQRWNPLSGFTSRGLPTDRPMWSDSTGRRKRSKETTRLLNMHWAWVSDWTVDFLAPGGVDSDGWQYAIDFSTSYHPHKNLTDYVRRRRWVRKCRLQTSGPWNEVGHTKLTDISLQVNPGLDEICLWAVGSNGDALFRKGVTTSNPMGEGWEHVPCDQPLESISCGCGNQVWAVGKKGTTYWRFGITTTNPIGKAWEPIEGPRICGQIAQITRVSVARWAVWALDTEQRLFVRREVTPVFPEGTHWQHLTFNSSIEGLIDVSASGDEVWAITKAGQIARRIGVNSDNPIGNSWALGLNANWKSISARSFTSKTVPKRS